MLLKPGDIYHANPQMVKRYISNHFHRQHLKLTESRQKELMNTRRDALERRGLILDDLIVHPPPETVPWEFNPYQSVQSQKLLIISKLDKQAQKEQKRYEIHERFRPKPFMAPNLYLPAYLEVSFRSCTGAFVRLPHIKKDGLMEIPSPFPEKVHQRAAAYYYRYGRGVRRQGGYRGYKLFWSKRKLRA